MDPQIIDSIPALEAFFDGLPNLEGPEPVLYMDLEGNNLSRKGTLSLVNILVEPRHTVHLVDVTSLGEEAFHTSNQEGQTLRQILESSEIIKVFFDVRNDSDALYSLFGIRVAGTEDLQLMELASRNFSKKHVNGLAKCIERDSTLSYAEKRAWRADKDRGHRLFDAAQGGDYTVFDKRPLSAEMIKYCAQDVIHMPGLREVYREKLCDAWWRRIEQETIARIGLSQRSDYNGKGMHMAVGPPEWLSWRPSYEEKQTRTLFVKQTEPLKEAPTAIEPTLAPCPHGPDEAREAVARAMAPGLTSHTENDGDGDDDDDDDKYDYDDFRNSSSSFGHFEWGIDDSDGDRDFTACDKECGYCGRCMY